MKTYAKAMVAAVLAALAVLTTALQSGGVTAVEWVSLAVAALVTFSGTYFVPNVGFVNVMKPNAVEITPLPPIGD